jgi:hypothetical protein
MMKVVGEGYVRVFGHFGPPRLYKGTDSLVGSIFIFEVDYFGRRQSRVHSSCAVLADSRLGVGVAVAGGCWGHIVSCADEDDGCFGMKMADDL